MTLTVDTFWTEAAARLETTGWSFTLVSRYDPTRLEGLTPTGKAFIFTAVGSTLTHTIAGNTRTRTVAQATWEPGPATVDALIASRTAFPVNQR